MLVVDLERMVIKIMRGRGELRIIYIYITYTTYFPTVLPASSTEVPELFWLEVKVDCTYHGD